MDTNIKAHIATRISVALDEYVKDLQALDEPSLAKPPGGVARSPYDFTYEVAFVNRRIATRLRGGVPEKFAQEGWIVAPEQFRSKDALIKEIQESTTAVLDAWNALPESQAFESIATPSGETNAVALASMCATHMSYHDAQLNYLQALLGDDELHWE